MLFDIIQCRLTLKGNPFGYVFTIINWGSEYQVSSIQMAKSGLVCGWFVFRIPYKNQVVLFQNVKGKFKMVAILYIIIFKWLWYLNVRYLDPCCKLSTEGWIKHFAPSQSINTPAQPMIQFLTTVTILILNFKHSTFQTLFCLLFKWSDYV